MGGLYIAADLSPLQLSIAYCITTSEYHVAPQHFPQNHLASLRHKPARRFTVLAQEKICKVTLHHAAYNVGLQEIAREKAGIFKTGVPAFTVSQPQDALQALQVQAQPTQCLTAFISAPSDIQE